MLQALQSRSPASVDERLEKVEQSGSGQFMDKFYVGYGHKSIGDCGTTTVFIEEGTMLAAKSIQDWPLYCGQEASTRYMDFSESVFDNPLGSKEGEQIQERWREFYLRSQKGMREHIQERYPRQSDEDPKIYARAVNARAFDVLRSILPAGAATNFSWHTNLRQAYDQLQWVIAHPDPTVSKIGKRLLAEMKKKYRNSFNHRENEAAAEFRCWVMSNNHFLLPEHFGTRSGVEFYSGFEEHDIRPEDMHMLEQRPRGVEVPRFLEELGHIRTEFPLDFGSYRDLQRHRNGVIRMPLLTTEMGFQAWYLGEMPLQMQEDVADLIYEQADAIDKLDCDPYRAQSYIAMGFQVPCRVTQGLPGFVYRIELRSGKTVHPTLRSVVLQEIEFFKRRFPNIPIYVDEDPDSWTVRRGKQTIEEKQ